MPGENATHNVQMNAGPKLTARGQKATPRARLWFPVAPSQLAKPGRQGLVSVKNRPLPDPRTERQDTPPPRPSAEWPRCLQTRWSQYVLSLELKVWSAGPHLGTPLPGPHFTGCPGTGWPDKREDVQWTFQFQIRATHLLSKYIQIWPGTYTAGGWDSRGSEIQMDLGRPAFLLQIVRLGFKPVTQPGARAAFLFFLGGGARPLS